MLKDDQIVELPDGRFEQRIQVDRRKLETMITGRSDPHLYPATNPPTAEQFFASVMAFSNAHVAWPAQLKIGAKTKKDPYVKVTGTIEEIDRARNIILNSLQIKKERVSLKMEIHHSIHSHIIGKGGKGIQKVMKMSNCHIHFPDSNKYNESAKSDQVSISGSAFSVHLAAQHLRSMCPLTLFLDVPWFHVASSGVPDLRQLQSQIDVVVVAVERNIYSLVIRMTSSHEASALFAIRLVLHHFGLTDEYQSVRTSVIVKEEMVFQLEHVDEQRARIRDLCQRNSVTMQLLPDKLSISLFGPPAGVLEARKAILGLSSVQVSFDCNLHDVHYPIDELEREKRLHVASKRKSGDLVTFTIKSIESRLVDVLQSRELLLALPPTKFAADIDNSPPSLAPPPPPPPPRSPSPSPSQSATPNDDDLGGKKAAMANRDEMLIKATHAIFDENSLATPRYPTDLWSGYGFSCSLPADLLKGMFDLSTMTSETSQPATSQMGSSRGLCSVREEDELSDFSASSANNFNLRSRVFDAHHHPPRNIFSASTSAFDSSSLPYDVQWDINYFTDPSMVLAQLGCNEYMTQLREQEIDMHAFLLLDEQNLKDIGVGTIGARKKIHHAILKLRDSARMNGYSI